MPKHLHRAKMTQDDEFYTRPEDVCKELTIEGGVGESLSGSVVFCPCDGERSGFWRFFVEQGGAEQLGVLKVVAVKYNKNGRGEYREFSPGGKVVSCSMPGDGDMFSSDVRDIVLLLKARFDRVVVVTNPPFSRAEDFVIDLLANNGPAGWNVDFCIVSPMLLVTHRKVFELVRAGRLWAGENYVNRFVRPDGSEQRFGNVCWLTNIDYRLRYSVGRRLPVQCPPEHFEEYVNMSGVFNVDRVRDVPAGELGSRFGVPVSYFPRWNPGQFDIEGLRHGDDGQVLKFIREGKEVCPFNRIILREVG